LAKDSFQGVLFKEMYDTYDRHKSEDVMDQVVTVIRDHLSVGHHQDLDESLLRDGTTSSTPTNVLNNLLPFICKCSKNKKRE
jgi:hypothetical protein